MRVYWKINRLQPQKHKELETSKDGHIMENTVRKYDIFLLFCIFDLKSKTLINQVN